MLKFQSVVRSVVTLVAMLALIAPSAHAQSSRMLKARELIALHDARATVANGNLYLKSQWLTAARELLRDEGMARGYNADWNASHPIWQRAEAALVQPLIAQTQKRFEALAWLKPQWSALIERDFSEADIDLLLAHFHTDIGAQQLRMLDHSLANNVLTYFTLTWRMPTAVRGTEAELRRTQELFYRGDEAMYFEATQSPEGVQFAFSPHGRKCTYDIVTNVVLMFVRDLQDQAAAMPAALRAALPQAQPIINSFPRN